MTNLSFLKFVTLHYHINELFETLINKKNDVNSLGVLMTRTVGPNLGLASNDKYDKWVSQD